MMYLCHTARVYFGVPTLNISRCFFIIEIGSPPICRVEMYENLLHSFALPLAPPPFMSRTRNSCVSVYYREALASSSPSPPSLLLSLSWSPLSSSCCNCSRRLVCFFFCYCYIYVYLFTVSRLQKNARGRENVENTKSEPEEDGRRLEASSATTQENCVLLQSGCEMFAFLCLFISQPALRSDAMLRTTQAIKS